VKGTYVPRAQIHVAHRLIISIEMRPPRAGELGWTVSMNADVKEALCEVIDGRGDVEEGIYGYGVRAGADWPEIERDEWAELEIDPATGKTAGVKARGVHESRCVTVVVALENIETGEVVLL
jgi:hypothetical protein